MSTIRDFENAPVGATATSLSGNRAVKMGDGEQRWITRGGGHWSDKEMARWGYTLDQPAPATAREALDLAWELAHPVREGQKIPAGTLYMQRTKVPRGVVEALLPFTVWGEAAPIRTLDPLPDPEPEPERHVPRHSPLR